ncbi:10613_t:CDS:2, partial [Dentiscutata heterogama]
LAKTEAEISDTVFKHKKTKFSQLDRAMQLWVESIIHERLLLTEAIIKEKAIYFAHALSLSENTLKFSNAESVPIESLPEFQQELWEIIQEFTNAQDTSDDEESTNQRDDI